MSEKNIICKQENYSLFDVYGADEAFVTGTFAGLTTVVSVDGREIGTNSKNRIAKILTKGYKELVNEQIEIA
jgi:branched-chain amino acid aminotransferase